MRNGSFIGACVLYIPVFAARNELITLKSKVDTLATNIVDIILMYHRYNCVATKKYTLWY